MSLSQRGRVIQVALFFFLQGHEIPHCYWSGTLILPNCAFFQHVLLQYIPDAVNLNDIAVKPGKSVIASLIKTVSASHFSMKMSQIRNGMR
jgi:hypothetical protein